MDVKVKTSRLIWEPLLCEGGEESGEMQAIIDHVTSTFICTETNQVNSVADSFYDN